MSIRIERRDGKINVDIRVRGPNGIVKRERRLSPVQTENGAWAWAKRRESFLIAGRDATTGASVDRPGSVYFLRGPDGTVKIGWTSDIAGRMLTLQIGSAGALELLAAEHGKLADERALHRRFQHLRVRGEWFTLGPDLLAYIDELRRIGAHGERGSRKGVR